MFPGRLELQTCWDGGNPERSSLPTLDGSSSKNPFASYCGWESACLTLAQIHLLWCKCLHVSQVPKPPSTGGTRLPEPGAYNGIVGLGPLAWTGGSGELWKTLDARQT